jgi:AraC-like DNA-binding protein
MSRPNGFVALLGQGLVAMRVQEQLATRWPTVLCSTVGIAHDAMSVGSVAAFVYLPIHASAGEGLQRLRASVRASMPATVVARLDPRGGAPRAPQKGRDDDQLHIGWTTQEAGASVTAQLERAIASVRHEDAVHRLLERVPALPQRLMAYGLAQHGHAVRVEDASRVLRTTRKALWLACHAANLAPPQTLLAWCRLIRLTQHLASSRHSVESVAYELGFGSAPALRNFTRRTIASTPSQLRTCEAIAAVVAGAGTACGIHCGMGTAPIVPSARSLPSRPSGSTV